jgi:hypothetical protein
MALLPKSKVWRVIIVLGASVLLVPILVVFFYAEEDWRGKRDWENCKHELEAKGEVLDWNAFVPSPVPDGQNFFNAPKMQEWFVKPLSGQVTNDFVIRLSSAGTTATISNEVTAIKYLTWSDQFKPDFDLVHNALKRPYARMDGGYSDPTTTPVPNFATVRALSQTLSQRAKCYLFLHQPEKALGELALLNDSRRLLEAAPTGKPMTLVAAMVNVAVVGIYVNTIGDGIKSNAWLEPQLISIQKQLEQVNLSPFVANAMRGERAMACYIIETRAINKLDQKHSNMARGWFYQNMVTAARWDGETIGSIDITNDFISPKKIIKVEDEINAIKHFRPYTFFAAIITPNFSRAFQTLAYNQTLANEAQIVCALERYHLAQGEYPKTLDALTPKFIEKIPHDIIGGQPLHYRRTDDGKFLLYSIGWNEKDDAGSPGTLTDVKNGDWIWN